MKTQGTVLLVDDEPNILLALEFLIRQKGFQVVKATNGTEGVALAKRYKPDIAVLDVMMPGLDGFEVAKTIRKTPELSHTTIIFLTAKSAAQDRQKGYANGGEIYLSKPFDNQELVDIISEVYQYG
ncbi:MAG: response regulator [Saprospiraceae bacterium]